VDAALEEGPQRVPLALRMGPSPRGQLEDLRDAVRPVSPADQALLEQDRKAL